MEVALTVLLNAAFWAIAVVLLSRRIDRKMDPSSLVKRVRGEVDGILTELNGATERNLSLLEERIRRLSNELEQADRRIAVLRRESEKHDVSRRVYSDILERRRKEGRDGAESSRLTNAGTESSPSRSSAPVPESQAAQDGDQTPEGQEGASSETEREYTRQPGNRQKLREEVRRLHDSGMSAEIIAARVGSTVGEVELIISLERS